MEKTEQAILTQPQPHEDTLSGPALALSDPSLWLLAGGVGALALTVYVMTLAPGLTFANSGTDGGDLISAARTLGVPHPSGYPTYTLLAWLFAQIPVGVIAYRVNLLSAVCAALAIGLFFRLAVHLFARSARPLLLATCSALTLAFSTLLWSQAVIAEVYALLMLFAAWLTWLLVRWRDGGDDRLIWLAALSLGLGLGNHLTLIFVAPAALILAWPERKRWFRARVLLPAVFLFALGLGVYAYLPLAARRGPPVNWGNPQTWRGFLWVVTGAQYQPFAFGLDLGAIPARIYAWAALAGDQFGWWGLPLVLVGMWGWWQRDRRFLAFGLVWGGLVGVYAFFYDTGDSHMYLLPVILLAALGWGEGVRRLLPLAHGLGPAVQRLALLVVILLPLASAALHWQSVDPDDDWFVHAYIYQITETAEEDGLIVVRGDGPTFALWYGVYAEERRPDLSVVSGPLLAFIWYREQVRQMYPDLILNEPIGADVTIDDLVRDLMESNLNRAVYATDPKEMWEEWFDFVKEEESSLYRVWPKSSSGL
jgi:hypothetical protein